jgi:adenylylsulfate kinase
LNQKSSNKRDAGKMATVYWITGLSGAGKTTIGKIFYERLKAKQTNTVFFDGDTLRKVFGDDLGYSKDERRKCAMRYSRLCALMVEQGVNVVICTISMFDSVREWNRENIHDYKEIYVKVSMEELHRRDQKGLYSGNTNESEKAVVGIQVDFEEPKRPDLILDNDGVYTPIQQVEKILEIIER